MNQSSTYQKSRYGLIDRVLSRKSRNHDDLFDFCIMMFNSNREKYEKLNNQEIQNKTTLDQVNKISAKVEKSKRWTILLFMLWFCNFLLCLIAIGMVRK